MGKKILLLTFMLVCCTFGVAGAGWLTDAIDNAVERTGTRAVDDAADTAYEGAKDGARKGATETVSPERSSAPANRQVVRPKPGLAGPSDEDDHFVQGDDYFVADTSFGRDAYIYVGLAKMVTEPSPKTKGQGEFFHIVDGRKLWTKNFWRSRIATERDLKLGTTVIMFESHMDDGVYMAPEAKDSARGGAWFMAKITDMSDTYKGYVTVSGNYKVGLGNLRIITK